MKAFYSHRHGKLKHFHEKHHVLSSEGSEEPHGIEHSHCLKKIQSSPSESALLWDFPTSVTLKSLPSRQT